MRFHVFLVRSEYRVEQNKPVVYLFQRENGKRILTLDDTLTPYFFVPESEVDRLQGIRCDPNTYEAIDGTKLKRVYTTLPEDVPKLRDKYSRSWEADIVFQTRYIIDQVDSIEATVPKVLFIDIEVDNSGRIPNVDRAEEPIICITVYDNLTNLYSTCVWRHDLSPGMTTKILDDTLHEVHYFKSEDDMLKSFVEFINVEEPDVITGWNSNRFDLPYLINRLAVLHIDSNKLSPMNSVYIRDNKDVVIKGIALIDLYDAYRHFSQGMEESYKLDFIAKKVIGKGKLGSENNIRWMWKNKLDELIEYNANDVLLCKNINEKLKLLEFLDELRRISFCQLEDTLSASRLTDTYVLRYYHNKKIFPTKTHHEKVPYEGAFVGSWAEGIYENVIAFDLKSLYPSLICLFNLSPDTIISEDESNWGDNNICVNNTYFRKDKKGFLVEIIENLTIERTRYKKLMKNEPINSDNWNLYYNRQYALKTLLNALYGQTAYPNSRIYSPKVAETTTHLGRKVIMWSKDFLEKLGCKVLYCDTDSLFIQTISGDVDFDEINFILSLLNESYDEFVKQVSI